MNKQAMKRMTFFPGAGEALVKQLASKFDAAKEVGEQFTATIGGLSYSGPVKWEHERLNWYIHESGPAPETQAKFKAPSKATPKKKAAPKGKK